MSPEYEIQRAVVEQIRQRGVAGLVFWHTPNGIHAGGSNRGRTVKRMKAIGLRPGVSDLTFLYDRRAFLLELKSTKGRLTDDQHKFLSDAAAVGAETAVCSGLDEAIRQLETWGLLQGTMQ